MGPFEVDVQQHLFVARQLLIAADRMQAVVEMQALGVMGDEKELAGNEQMLLHVDLAGPHSAPFAEATLDKLVAISAEQADLPRPALLGRVIGLPPKK